MKHCSTFLILICLICCLFSFTLPASAASEADITPGLYEISCAKDSDFVLDIPGCTVTDTVSQELQIYRSLDVNQQKFYLEILPGGIFRISSLLTGDALTVLPDSEKSTALSDPIRMDTLQRTGGHAVLKTQSWKIQDAGDGTVYLRSSLGRYLTLSDSSIFNGASVTVQNYTGKTNQRWILKKTWVSSEAKADTDLINPYEEDGAYSHLRLTIQFGSREEILTASELAGWYTETEDHQLTVDPARFTAYAESLAAKYDTLGQPHTFVTSSGSEITLEEGSFGWKLDVEQTAQLLQESIASNGRISVDPIWSHEGGSLDDDSDIGDSYVEIDLTGQKVWLYKDGELLLETDCVTGTYGTDRQTPAGLYTIYYRQSPAVLTGPGYSSPVEYWMAFNGGIGLHDANWRSTFGGDIYKTNGSHGCINLPTEAARIIYENTGYGYLVICYN